MKTIGLEFEGYRREEKKGSLADRAGIYCVYAGTYDESTEKVNVQRLLYIGKAVSIKDRIGEDSHEHLKDWKRALVAGQELMYTYAFLSDADDRTRAESALIYYCKPPINDSGTEEFHHPDTKVELSGEHKFIPNEITVYANGEVKP